MYVCLCHAVTDGELAQVIAGGAETVNEVGRACGAGTGCGSCLERIGQRLTAAGGCPLERTATVGVAS